MSFKVGLDFDNTMINYENLFHTLACEKDWISNDVDKSKKAVKDLLLQEDGNDLRWQKLQAIAYGERIFDAPPFQALKEFIDYCKKAGHEIFVISHKTETSNFDPSVKLRKHALEWMEKNDFIPKLIEKKAISFASTREEKVKIIDELNIDLFIDDLASVLNHDHFPKKTVPVLFSPSSEESSSLLSAKSWKDCIDYLKVLGQFERKEIEFLTQNLSSFPSEIHLLERDGNNRIWIGKQKDGRSFILKSYFKSKNDDRNRAKTEFNSLSLLWKEGVRNIPEPLAFNDSEQLALYSFLDGKTITKDVSTKHVDGVGKFFSSLKKIHDRIDTSGIPRAAASHLSFKDYVDGLNEREAKIIEGCESNEKVKTIHDFMKNAYPEVKATITERFLEKAKKFSFSLDDRFPKSMLILSPSDFGFHNIIIDPKDHVQFIDFEYFGIDDSAKLMADFFHHVKHDISWKNKWQVFDSYLKNNPEDEQFQERFEAIVDMIGLEWILIVLNIAAPGVMDRRKFANSSLDLSKLVETRLQNATHLVMKIKENLKMKKKHLTLPEHV